MTTHTNSPAFVQFLLESAGGGSGAAVELVQTHISWVFLVNDTVYKFKKPVNFGFLDFSTLEQRRFYCEQEVALNRRLCPDIYLGMVAVCEQNGGLALLPLEQAKDVVEYGIKMRRMPEERMMPHLIERGELGAAHIDQISLDRRASCRERV